ncbi:uridine phosphorylase [Pseudoflavonifractor sp. An85]|uniref:uridine phosphorylase n=1 Tax=Pseudoflavonifractor sp. An85 TaxID=1965661 RepID=UPI000B385961|nr:uridine phosphorylase [Pseudoflavonifractor sp. An85]OUN25393.1 uridine phosphorylase [Pseudoflavonifractor sp. An85]
MQYHIQLDQAMLEGAKYAILAGDPGRIETIAQGLDCPKFLARNREYTSYLGYLAQQPVLVMSHGIGGPSTAIAVEELAQLGVTTMIRVGTSGGMQQQVRAGDAVIVQAAIRQDGTSREYLPIEYPAVADFSVTAALKQAAIDRGMPHHVGVVQCKDSFYGQHSPQRMPVQGELLARWEAWIKGGALASEMETAALFVVSSVLRIRAGAVMLCIWNQERDRAGLPHEECHDTQGVIDLAIDAVKHMIIQDGMIR